MYHGGSPPPNQLPTQLFLKKKPLLVRFNTDIGGLSIGKYKFLRNFNPAEFSNTLKWAISKIGIWVVRYEGCVSTRRSRKQTDVFGSIYGEEEQARIVSTYAPHVR